MNQRITLLHSFKLVLLAMLFTSGVRLMAGPVLQVTSASTNSMSVFIMPASPTDGRDPFYPASTRPYQTSVVPNAKTADVNMSLISLQGISGQPPQRLAIINKRTFATGDNLEVSTSQGRIRVRCLEISENSAVIEVNGQRHELRYEEKQ
ncbi:MAG TPA: hypothetical protein VNN22_16590 [Verrucomicrobiae bacterium]|nr:hypothetical protein [Verrucomicrobiae bacterium]